MFTRAHPFRFDDRRLRSRNFAEEDGAPNRLKTFLQNAYCCCTHVIFCDFDGRANVQIQDG